MARPRVFAVGAGTSAGYPQTADRFSLCVSGRPRIPGSPGIHGSRCFNVLASKRKPEMDSRTAPRAGSRNRGRHKMGLKRISRV